MENVNRKILIKILVAVVLTVLFIILYFSLFNKDYSESYIKKGEWSIVETRLPKELQDDVEELTYLVNKNIPYGCCGGCL